MSGIKVLYAKTDNTTGYKEFGCVVLRTTEDEIKYYGDVYEPAEGCRYKVLYEVGDNETMRLVAEEPACEFPQRGWVSPPLRERVLRVWMKNKK